MHFRSVRARRGCTCSSDPCCCPDSHQGTPAKAGNRPESLGPTKRVQSAPKRRRKQIEASTGADSGPGALVVL